MGTSHVVVVGAGLAGLSAAVELKRAGYEVELFERTRLLGGKATSFTVGGVEVDNGQHVYLGCCTEFIDFVQDVWTHMPRPAGGTSPRAEPADTSRGPVPLITQERFEATLLAPGKPAARLREAGLPSPLQFAPSLLGYRHLSPVARLRVAFALLRARRPARPDETCGAWLRRHRQTDETLRAFWEPFLVPALNAPLDEVAAEDALFVIKTAFLGPPSAARFGYSRVPLAHIAGAAADQIDRVHLRTSVSELDAAPAEDGSPRVSGVVLSDGSRVPCDAVVLAVPPAALARLLATPERYGLHDLDRFRTAPIIDVHLWYEGVPHPLASSPATGRGAGGEGTSGSPRLPFAALLGSPVQWVFEKGPGYLCCSLSAAGEHIHRPEQELIELCHRELSAVLPDLRGATLTRGAATRDREATFIPTPGLRRPGPRTTCPEVVIAGAWTDTGWPATMESAVRSGRAAARLLAARLPASTRPSKGAISVG